MQDSWSRYLEMVQQLQERRPIVGPSLTPAIEPLQQSPFCVIVELVDSLEVPGYRVVVVVSTQFPVERLKEFSYRQIAILPAPLGEIL